MIWMLVHGFASACSVVGEGEGPSEALAWPAYPRESSTDGILVVQSLEGTAVGVFQLLDPSGAEIAVTRYDLGDLVVVVPTAPMAPGQGYRVAGLPFDVVDRLADEGAPPIPVTREVASEVTYWEAACPDEARTDTSVVYRLCARVPLSLAVIGGSTAPPDPTLAQPGDVALGTGDGIGITEGLSPGWSGTLWLGSFDGAGRFGGWTADPLDLPSAGTLRLERAEGAEGGAGTTPTAFESCPTSGAWSTEFDQTCSRWVPSTHDCAPEPVADVGGGGCGGGWASAGFLAPSLLARRRRR